LSAQKESRDLAAGQASLFSEVSPPANLEAGPAPAQEWDAKERLAYEKETLGFYFSGHPLRAHQRALASLSGPATKGLSQEWSGKAVDLGGMITALKKRKTRRGDWMAVFHLEDLEGSIEVLVFPELFKSCQDRLLEDAVVRIRGKFELEDGRGRIVAEEVAPLAGAAERRASRMILSLDAGAVGGGDIQAVRRLLAENPGECAVQLQVVQAGGYRFTLRPAAIRVGPSPGLTDALERLLGKGAVSYR
jgi:DNA polymerase-3 subunit alpha